MFAQDQLHYLLRTVSAAPVNDVGEVRLKGQLLVRLADLAEQLQAPPADPPPEDPPTPPRRRKPRPRST